VVFALFLDVFSHQLTGGWFTYFLIMAVLQRLLLDDGELFDLGNISWLSVGFLGLCVLDVVKYGRGGISWCIILMAFCLFRAGRHYFLSGRLALKIALLLFIVLVDLCGVRPWILGQEVSMAMTIKEILGTLATLTLVLLGVRGSRFWLFFKNNRERKVWTPNRKSAL
jgi:hypothetical protein